MILKEFTETDWFAFAGAERFEEYNSDPLIGDGENYFVIADPKGLEVFLEVNDERTLEEIWYIECEHTPVFYKLLLNGFPERMDIKFLKELGFEKI